MYIYIGNDTVINSRDIIGIFDSDNTTVSKVTRYFLNQGEKKGRVRSDCMDIPKSFIVCAGKDGEKLIYLCQLSPQTLSRRSETEL